MTDGAFKALVVDETDGTVRAGIDDVSPESLPEGDVLVSVEYSTVNYKDGLAVTGKGKVVRRYPMVPGVDFAGTVEKPASPRWKAGDRVILTGWGVGETHWGGLAQRARVDGEWLVALPDGMSTREAMAIGTAGFTAMLAIMELERHGMSPGGPEVVVTGAAGGLGSVAVALLARSGYRVVASTGRQDAHEYLRGLGAAEIIDRDVLPGLAERPLQSARWAAAVDAVGGATLAGLLTSMREGGSIAVCGNAGGAGFSSTVFPFILRGVTMIGIESVRVPRSQRGEAWNRLGRELPAELLNGMTQVVPLEAVPHLAEEILAGKVRGRVVVDVNA